MWLQAASRRPVSLRCWCRKFAINISVSPAASFAMLRRSVTNARSLVHCRPSYARCCFRQFLRASCRRFSSTFKTVFSVESHFVPILEEVSQKPNSLFLYHHSINIARQSVYDIRPIWGAQKWRGPTDPRTKLERTR